MYGGDAKCVIQECTIRKCALTSLMLCGRRKRGSRQKVRKKESKDKQNVVGVTNATGVEFYMHNNTPNKTQCNCLTLGVLGVRV